MKLILFPVTTVHVLPAVTAKMADASVIVTGGSLSINGVSYKQVQNSFGTDAYSPFDMYMQSDNLPQLTTPMQFFIFDSDGNKLLSPLTPTVDPYQPNTSIYFQPRKNQVVFNGNSGLHFSVLPLTQIIFQFICLRTSNQSLGHAANFRQLEKVQNVPYFFLEYDEDLTKKAPLVLSTKVINSTTATQTIDLFSSPYDLMQNVNNHTEYKWDITGIAFPATVEVTLQYRTVSAITFSVYDTFTSGNLLSILAALNALGVSFFYTYSELGFDYIATYSDSYVFGDLTLDTTSGGNTTTTTTSTTTATPPPPTSTTTTTTSTTTATPPPPTSTTTTTTSTTTATPPPPTSTTTTTTTSTTTSGFINVTFYAELNAASANAHNLWYSTDAWATSALVSATNIGTVGGLIGTVVVPRGATVYAAVGNNLDITASTAVSGKVSVTPNDYAALPLACGGSVSVTEFVDFTWNILANSLSFNLACTP